MKRKFVNQWLIEQGNSRGIGSLTNRDKLWEHSQIEGMIRFNEWHIEKLFLTKVGFSASNLNNQIVNQILESQQNETSEDEEFGSLSIKTKYLVNPRTLSISGYDHDSRNDGDISEYSPIKERITKSMVDWYLTVGTFTATVSTSFLLKSVDKNGFTFDTESFIHVYDKYDWHSGLGTSLFDNWCSRWKNFIASLSGENYVEEHFEIKCENLEGRTQMSVTDNAIGNMHLLGLAREFELYGISEKIQRTHRIDFDRFSSQSEVNSHYRSLMQVFGQRPDREKLDLSSL